MRKWIIIKSKRILWEIKTAFWLVVGSVMLLLLLLVVSIMRMR